MSTVVLLAIKNALVCEGIRRILMDSCLAVMAAVDDLDQLDPSMIPGWPECSHVLLVDRVLLGEDPAKTITQLLERFPSARIVSLISKFDFNEMAAIFAAGGYAYLLDHVPFQSLVAIIQMVSLGQKVAPSELVDLLGSMVPAGNQAAGRSSATTAYNLTEREHVVLAKLEQGQSNKAIAYELVISESAIKATVKSILRKLGVQNRTQAALIAREIASHEPVRCLDSNH